MAERRMFTKKITESDAFLEMPSSAQNLYFHLNMEADDDGFVNAPKKIMRMVGASDDDIKLLIMKKFVLVFDSGVIVIKHWRMHNLIRSDRYHPTQYQEEFRTLELKEDNAYRQPLKAIEEEPERCLATTWQPNDNQMEPEVRLGKDRRGKVSIVRHKHGEYQNVLLTDEEMEKLKTEFPNDYQQRIERLSEYIASTGKRYKNHLATIRSWARKDRPREEKPPVYDSSTNKDMSADDEAELLRLMKGEI